MMINVCIVAGFLVALMPELGMVPDVKLTKGNSNEWNHRHNHNQFVGTEMERHVTLPRK